MAMSKQKITLTTLIMASIMIVLPTKTEALDMTIPFDDPFIILEQIPFNLAYKTLDTTIDLAHADWKETSMHHIISIDVPGIKRWDINVEVEENMVLKVSGEKKADEETIGLW
nr:hypothetical protein [Tanacetum cinerariifolium]